MKVLVTGGSGFLGKALKAELDWLITPSSKELDVTKKDWFENYSNIDTVIHLAAKTNPKEGQKVNTLGTENIVEFCRKNNSKLIFSSTNVYGIPQILPIKEDHPLNPTNPYTKSKLAAEKTIISSNLDGVILRFSNIYGPNQTKNLVSVILSQLKDKGSVKLFNPETRRDFLYIGDAMSSIKSALNFKKTGVEIFNIGTSKSTSIRELVLIMSEIKGDFKVDYEDKETTEPKNIFFDNSKAARYLGWAPLVNIKEGLKLTLSKTL